MRSLDWSRTPLGPPESWPQSLRTSVSICLSSRFSMILFWGPTLVQLYNDAYTPILGVKKHPAALGQPAIECWPEIWDVIGPMLEDVLYRSASTWSENQLLLMDRFGYLEETYFTYSFSPIVDESGVGGVFCATTETTNKVVGSRRLQTLRDLAARGIGALSVEQACRTAADVLGENLYDVPFAALYLVDQARTSARLTASTGGEQSEPVWSERIDLGGGADADAWSLGTVVASGQPVLLQNLGDRFASLPTGAWPDPPEAALILPVTPPGQELPTAILIAGVSPRRALDEEYRTFYELMTRQVASAVADALAYESERQRAEALAELDRAKTAFFSNVSHEFRTPLTLMLGPLEEVLARRGVRIDDLDRQSLEVAHRNGLRLQRLVNTLLDFSRLEAGRIQASYEPTDLCAYTTELASTFRSAIERAGLRLTVDCQPLAEPVYVDREMWEKIVFNLLSNAFKFTFDGEIRVSLRAVGDHAELTVEDSGIGIAPDELPRLFERFHRIQGVRARTHEGTGIGLALAQELIKLHGGQISVTSTLDRGSTFTVSVPLGTAHLPAERIAAERSLASTALGAAPYVDEMMSWLPTDDVPVDGLDSPIRDTPERDETARPATTEPFAARTAQARLLVADDNRDMRDYLARLLRPQYTVKTVANGEQALTAAIAEPPDLILSDIMMPGLDGFGLVAALRDEPSTRDVPIILLSARAGEEARIEGLQARADDYLVKPFSARELLARIEGRLELTRLRARAMQQEQAAREQLESLFKEAPAAICLFSGPEHVFVLANPRYAALSGGRALVGRPIREALPELAGQGVYELLDRVYATGEPYVGNELPLHLDRDDDGTLDVIYFNFVCVPMRDPHGDVEGIFLYAYDLTDQVRAREAAEEAARARQEFLSIASHELRNPIAAVKAAAQALRRMRTTGRLTEERLDRYLATLEAGAIRLATLTDDLLDVSRLQQGALPLRRRPTDLDGLIREVVARQPTEARHRIMLDLATGLTPLLVDPDRIDQIVTNLLENAVKYSPDGGAIQIRLAPDGDGMLVRVRDQGIGLPAGAAERIFQPFGRASNAISAHIPGLGLGLYVCHQIADQHGGRLWAESAGEGQGTTMQLWLPLVADAESDAES